MLVVVECGLPHSLTAKRLETLSAKVYVNRVWFPDETEEPLELYRDLTQRVYECAETYDKITQDLENGKSVVLINGIHTYLATAKTIGLEIAYAYLTSRRINPNYTVLIDTPIPAAKAYVKEFDVDKFLSVSDALRWVGLVLNS
ncbi:MAG: hypothetical protein CMP20_15355 [Rickettsiales bacterium]|nr:hypothetical protein [Rickettsiales bacterium]